jgi:hypothetical protein
MGTTLTNSQLAGRLAVQLSIVVGLWAIAKGRSARNTWEWEKGQSDSVALRSVSCIALWSRFRRILTRLGSSGLPIRGLLLVFVLVS